MEKNPVFGNVFHNSTYLPPTPESLETREEESHYAFVPEKKANPPHKTEKTSRVNTMIAILSIALTLSLALGLAGTVLAVLNYNMENNTLEYKLSLPVNQTTVNLEIADLREMLNQSKTEQNLAIANLREMLNESDTEQNSEIANLREMLNQSENTLSTVQQQLCDLQNLFANAHPIMGTLENPASSCSDIAQDSPSGEYWIQTSSSNSPVQVYCDMNPRNCSCNTTGGWTRVANLDMTEPSQQCPDGFRPVTRTTAPLRLCGRPDNNFRGCVSTTFPVHGIEYSHVCGRIIGYQDQTPDAFYANFVNLTIDETYVDGVSLTHGQLPRQHIWTFAASLGESYVFTGAICPCTQPSATYIGTIPVPPYVGNDYFCETAERGEAEGLGIFYTDDPLWNGQGCGGTSTCCSFNNPPWFCKQLPQPTTDDIELRLCADQEIANEDTPLERVEIYIK